MTFQIFSGKSDRQQNLHFHRYFSLTTEGTQPKLLYAKPNRNLRHTSLHKPEEFLKSARIEKLAIYLNEI